MGFETLIVLFVIGFVLEQVSKAAKRKEEARRRGAEPDSRPGASSAPEEDLSIGSILREIERVSQEAKRRAEVEQSHAPRPLPPRPLSPAPRPRTGLTKPPLRRPAPAPLSERGPLGRHSQTRLPSAEEVEEGASLEVEERIVNLDSRLAERPERKVVDLDEEAEAVAERRVVEAEARNREHRAVDHAAFDQRIRVVDKAVTVQGLTRAQLRSAMIWREILGPPVGLRGDADHLE
jgi:hypothetical protein